MFRFVKSIGAAALAVIVSAVAVPSAPVSALFTFDAFITYQGARQESGRITVPAGTSFVLQSQVDTDLPLQYSWEVVNNGSDRQVINIFPTPEIRLDCSPQGSIDVSLTVTAESGEVHSDELDVYCESAPTAQIDPAPAVPGQRELIPLGTKITFRSVNHVSPIYESQWRTTGVKGVAATGPVFTRTFDQPGNFGVQLTESNGVGRSSMWVGYTVVGPPKVAVTPAPANPKARMTVDLGSTITFNGARSVSPGGGSLTYNWRTTGVPGVAGDQTTFTRTFNRVGKFGVELTVVNEFGQTDKRWVGIEVVRPHR